MEKLLILGAFVLGYMAFILIYLLWIEPFLIKQQFKRGLKLTNRNYDLESRN